MKKEKSIEPKPAGNIESNAEINWRKLIDPKYLVPNMSRFPVGTQQKTLNVEELEDSQLLILLGGIKELAHLRGFSSVSYIVHSCSPQYVAVTCRIKWNACEESNNKEVEFESLADAHLDNTKSFAKDFLMAIAENRAFVRCVRNYLRINIVGSDEVGDTNRGQQMPEESSGNTVISSTHPVAVLTELIKKAGLNFDLIKATMLKEGVKEAEDWQDLSSIPNKTVFQLIQRIKKKVSENEDN